MKSKMERRTATRRRGRSLVFALLMTGLIPGLAAQANKGEIRGRVEADNGQPLPQATVVVRDQQGSLKGQVTTDIQGVYRFTGLSSGRYRLEVSAKGYVTQAKEEIALREEGNLEIDIRLREEKKTVREAEERGAQERNPNIFIRRVDLNALRDPLRRRGIDPAFLQFSAVENNYGTDMGAPVRQILLVTPDEPRPRFHGSIYEAHQNSVLNARPFFNVGPLRPSKRNQFGLSATGPFARDKTSFTTALDFVKDYGFVNGNIRVPLLTERTPATGDPGTDRIVAALLQAFPAEAPNLPDVAPRQLNTNSMRRINSVDWTFRVDHSLSPAEKLAFRYTFSNFSEDPFELVAGQNPKTDMRSQTFSATDVRNWSPRTMVQSSFFFDRLGALLLPTDHFRSLFKSLGLEDVPDIDFGGNFADVSVIGPGTQFPRKRFQNRFGGNTDISHQTGRHQLRIGGRLTRIQLNDLQSDNSRGRFVFSNNFGRTALENFLRGTPTKFTITLGNLYRGFRNWEDALYVQDIYQIRPGLTLTLGLRYEVITVPKEVNDQTRFSFKTDANNFAPQVAFAWAPGRESTVVRGGYGISFGNIFPGTYQLGRFNPPAVRTISVQNPSLVNPLKGVQIDPGQPQRSELNLLSPDLVSPYSHQYNLWIERRLPESLTFRIGYVGNRTLKLMFPLLTNRAEPVPGVPATTANVDLRRSDPRYLRIMTVINSGTFYYDSLRVNLTRSFATGLAFDVNYIFSKALTSSTDFAATLNREIGSPTSQNNVNFQADLKGPSHFDHRHALVLQYTYPVPFNFAPGSFAALMLQGWKILGMTELRTGLWFGIETSSDAPGFGNVDGEAADRPNLTNPAILGKAIDNPDTATSILKPEYFNTNIPVGGSGSEPFLAFRRDFLNNTNLAAIKSFRLSNTDRSLQFSAEFLNLFNHPLFDRPGDIFPSSIFGKIVDTQNKGRLIQFMLKFSF